MSENIPIDGSCCMACGHHWNNHGLAYKCCRGKCDCERSILAKYFHNREDYQARIRTLETQLRDANAAGVVLAKEAHHGRKCWIVTNSAYVVPSENVDALADARVETDNNPTSAVWLAKAKEASNGGTN